MFWSPWCGISEDQTRAHGARGVFLIVTPNRTQLIDQGLVRPLIQAILPLTKAREAFKPGLKGHNREKIVLRADE